MNPSLLVAAAFTGAVLAFITAFILKRKYTARIEDLNSVMHQLSVSLKDRISELTRENEQICSVLNNMREAVIAVDDQMRVYLMNPATEGMFGLPLSQAKGKSLIEVVRNPKIEELMRSALEQKSMVTEEVDLPRKGREVIRVNAVGADNGQGGTYGILVLYDVTEIRKLEKIRREFVANVSHELRTPLTSIKGFLETLLSGSVQDEGKSRRFLEMMNEDTLRLNNLIDDLLELSKIESRDIPLNRKSIDLSPVIEEAVKTFDAVLGEKNIRVENKLKKDRLPDVYADPQKMHQVFVNLLSNAIKFSHPRSSISISGKEDAHFIQISVKDSGIGIPPDALPRIFERFYRVDEARSREQGGTGLGLSIVKHIVEAHDGRVSCRSRVGEGSVFSIVLPRSFHP